MSDEHLPKAGQTLRAYLDASWPGVAAFLDDPSTALTDDPDNIELALHFAFLMGSTWRLASDVYDDHRGKRSKLFAQRLLALSELERAKMRLDEPDGPPAA